MTDIVASAWLRAAATDLRAARNCLEGPEPVVEVALYHCQQAAGKLAKTVLVLRGLHPPRTHDIARVIALLAADEPLRAELGQLPPLAPFAWRFRYPEGREVSDAVPPHAEAAGWIETLRAVRQSVAVAILASNADPSPGR